MKVESAALSLGISQLKAEQRKAIDAFVSGKDVFVCLPTGFGRLFVILCCLLFLIP